MRTRSCIISLATNDRRFAQALARLEESVRLSRFGGEFVGWAPGRFPPGCPSHADVPFAFKPFVFREAAAAGMELALWLDSVCVVIRKLDGLFRAIAEDGYVLFLNRGWKVGEWASDAALAALAVSREEAMTMPELNAAALGLNLQHPLGREFLERWHAAAVEGVPFRGVREAVRDDEERRDIKWNRGRRISSDPRVRGHRHDQTVAGILAHRLGMRPRATGLDTQSRRFPRLRLTTVIAVDREAGEGELRSVAQLRRYKYLGWLAQAARSLDLARIESGR